MSHHDHSSVPYHRIGDSDTFPYASGAVIYLLTTADHYEGFKNSTRLNDTLSLEIANSTIAIDVGAAPDIHYCHHLTRFVQQAFDLARVAVNAARDDVDKGISSTHGFKALFKQQTSIYPLKYYLTSIRDHTGKKNLKPDPSEFLSPELVCVEAVTYIYYKYLKLGYDPWVRCQHPYPAPQPPQAFWAVGTKFIFLCPEFFVQDTMPSSPQCPTVVSNMWIGDENRFYRDYQTYTLLYELIRFYFGSDALSPTSIPSEQFNWNSCALLWSGVSLRNPTNLLLYIARKCYLA